MAMSVGSSRAYSVPVARPVAPSPPSPPPAQAASDSSSSQAAELLQLATSGLLGTNLNTSA